MQHARSSPFPFSRGLPARLSPYPPPPPPQPDGALRSQRGSVCAQPPLTQPYPRGDGGGIEGKPLPLPQPNLPQGRPLPVM